LALLVGCRISDATPGRQIHENGHLNPAGQPGGIIVGEVTMQKNVAIEPELWERAGRVARAEGKTVDQLASEALTRELGRRALDRFGTEGELRRQGRTDDDVDRTVEAAITEVRRR
jgi:hypothetical protein